MLNRFAMLAAVCIAIPVGAAPLAWPTRHRRRIPRSRR